MRSFRRQLVRDLDCAGATVYLAFNYRRVACPTCGVKQETLEWLASSKHATQRFEDAIGRQCRDLPLTRVAELNRLKWDKVRRMDMAYMIRLLARHPAPKNLRAIGVDEISTAKGQTYAIVVADLDQRRPIWMSREPGRTTEDMDMFYVEIGRERSATIRLVIMDMWKPFRASTLANTPGAVIVYDKFHVMTYLGKALDLVRRSEYQFAHAEDRRLIKGQRYTLLSRRANLDAKKERALTLLLKANRRLNAAYLLKESFSQLWDCDSPEEARLFVDQWRRQLRWQRLEPLEKFAAQIERHWDGIAAYCSPENKVAMGFMEGLNNKIRVIQRRAYGIKDLSYLRLKVLTSFLPEL